MKLYTLLFTIVGVALSATSTAQPDPQKIKKIIPQNVSAYHITTHMRNMSLETYASDFGVYAKQYGSRAANASPERGILVRYSDDSVFKIDYKNGVVYATTIQECNNNIDAEKDLLTKAVATFTKDNQKQTYLVRKFAQQKAAVSYKSLSVVKQTYASPAGNNWKIYYMNPAITAKSKKSAKSATIDFLHPGPQNIIVHAERENGGKIDTLIELDNASKETVSGELFSMPPDMPKKILKANFHATVPQLQPGPGFKKDALTEQRLPIDVTMSKGPGPVMSNPTVYAIYWGAALNDRSAQGAISSLATSMLDIVSPKFSTQLGFYGINPGKVARNVFVAEDPSSSVGGGGSGAVVGAFLIKEMFDKDLPKIWWAVGDEDPLYMIVVTSDQVDNGGWSGYHFVVPTYFDSFVPFPFNFLVHEELPYALAKLPNNALKLGSEDMIQRDALCNSGSPACSAITSFDRGTENISHEYAEVCTDPTPFFSWVDAGRGTEGEIADICEDATLPLRSSTRINSTMVSTYWSVPDQSCVPGVNASIVIKEPVDNSQVMWQAGGGEPTLFALATSPTRGDIEDIRWTDENGRSIGNGVNIGSMPLTLGKHTITATAFVDGSSAASAVTHIEVVAKEPDVNITSPTSNITYASDDIINFRGTAMDPQDGDLPDNQLEWSINGTVIGKGKLLSTRVNQTGLIGVTLTATNSAGVKGASAVLFKLGPATGNSSIKIIQPITNTIFFNPDDVITFKAVATQADGSPVPENLIVWKDDRDGLIGRGSTIQHTLSGGPGGPIMHNVTVSIVVLNHKPTPHDAIVVQKGRVL